MKKIKSYFARGMKPRAKPNGENRPELVEGSPLWKPPSRKDPAAFRGELFLLNSNHSQLLIERLEIMQKPFFC